MSSPRRKRQLRRGTIVVLGALTLGLVGVPSALGNGWLLSAAPGGGTGTSSAAEPKVLTAVPADQPGKGLVHRGLQPGRKGTPCAGVYEIVGTDRCSHGPDEAPAGLSVKKPVAPVAAARPEPVLPESTTPLRRPDALTVAGPAGTTTAAATNAVVCDGDGVTGKRVQVLYVRAAGVESRFAKYEASFRTWAAGVDAIYDSSAQDTGGHRHLRYVTTADCQVDVREVEVPAGQMDDFSKTMSALKKLGYNRTDRKYMIFGDADVYCGIGTFAGDDQASAKNRSNTGPSYGRNDSGCWAASVAAHELGHNLGAVSDSAPNSSKAGHCVDEYDVMCYKDTASTALKIVCTNRNTYDNRLDCNHDDYCSTNPEPGSYLASHWNVANNEFLIPGEATTPTPTPTATASSSAPTPTPTVSSAGPSPTPTVTESASPTPTTPTPTTPTPTTPGPTSADPSPTAPAPTATSSAAKLTVTALTPTSARLSWPAAARSSRYAVVVDGRTASTVRATSASLTGLAPGTTYLVKIVVRGADHTDAVSVTTPAAAVPAAGSWFTLTNALTGDAAALYGSRSSVRTPLVAFAGDGGASQAWRLEGGKLMSQATGKCAGPLRAAAGSPLVQQECATAPAFALTVTAAGLSLSSGGLVVGLADTTYAGRPLLALQARSGARQQAWSASPL